MYSFHCFKGIKLLTSYPAAHCFSEFACHTAPAQMPDLLQVLPCLIGLAPVFPVVWVIGKVGSRSANRGDIQHSGRCTVTLIHSRREWRYRWAAKICGHLSHSKNKSRMPYEFYGVLVSYLLELATYMCTWVGRIGKHRLDICTEVDIPVNLRFDVIVQCATDSVIRPVRPYVLPRNQAIILY